MDDPRRTVNHIDDLLTSVKEIEELLSLPPGWPGRTDRIFALASSVSSIAPNQYTADLARKVRSEARDDDSRRIRTYLAHLRGELEQLRKAAPT